MRTHDSNDNPTPQPERFDEFTGGYDDVDHARAAKRINADLRAMDATPRGKHTPGPWEVRTDCGPSLYISERGKLSHANVWGRCEQSRETTIADARLIAAAPDLLEACKAAVFGANHIDCVRAMQEVLPQIRAAIARATC